MTIDRAREVKAWAGVLVEVCEEHAAVQSPYTNLMVHAAMRNLALAIDKALDEELSTSETQTLQ